MQGFYSDCPTLIFASVHSRVASAIPLAHRVGRTIFDTHGIWDCLQLTTHSTQYVDKLGLILERDIAIF